MKQLLSGMIISILTGISCSGQAGSSQGDPLIGKNAPELVQGFWFNSDTLTMAKLKGKVVLVEFWTFGCINCRRTIPGMNKLYNTFGRDVQFLTIHSPEFDYEKNISRVGTSLKDLNILFPVLLDNEFKNWEAWNQQYWPTRYIVDKEGIVRYRFIGEGHEEKIGQLLDELLEKN